MQVCSFLPSVTEILYALDLSDLVAGGAFERNYPPRKRWSAALFFSVSWGLCQIRPEPYTFFKIVEVFRTKMPDSATSH